MERYGLRGPLVVVILLVVSLALVTVYAREAKAAQFTQCRTRFPAYLRR